MTRRDWNLASIILAVLFGVPGLVVMVWTTNAAVAALVVLLSLTVVVIVFETLQRGREPNWTILRHRVELTIHDQAGERATYSKTLLLRANQNGVNSYAHRNISADGSVSEIAVTGGTIVNQQLIAGDYLVNVDFPTHLKRGETVETTLKLTLEGSFTDRPEETFTLHVDQDIRSALVLINLPAPVASVRVIYRHLGMDAASASPEIHGNSIRWEYKKVRFQRRIPPGEYEVRWTWPAAP